MIDLHTHTTISDGIYTPRELVQMAIKEGLTVLCMTDHNAVNYNLLELREEFEQIELPVGCEFSCGYRCSSGRMVQLHVGGIGFDMNDAHIQEIIRHNQASMKPYVEKVLLKLKENCSIDLCTYDELISRNATSQTVGRKHVAVELVRQGYCVNVDDAFDKYLGRGKPAFVSNAIYYVTFEELVPAILKAGGVASLCHPLKYKLDEKEFSELLTRFSEITKGYGAMEVYYSSYTDEQQQFLLSVAKEYSLMISAASDFHGDSEVRQMCKYPYEYYEAIKSKIEA